jgi:xanthine dehydrogenase accessory factor
MFSDFLSKAQELNEAAIPYAVAIVVHAEKPTSGKPGDRAIITIDGKLTGWIGGSCAQPTVIREAQTAMREGTSRFIRLSSDNDPAAPRDGLMVFPMTCYSEGALEIFIEPHLPQPQLLVIGTMPVAQALMRLGAMMQFRVIAVDPENTGATFPHAKTVLDNLGAVSEHIRPQTYVVVTSHGNYDEAALEHVLGAKPAYVGLVASRKRYESVVAYLKDQGVSEDDLTPLKAPAGLDIGAQQADEIALSIMAEIVQHQRRTAKSIDWEAYLSAAVGELDAADESTEKADAAPQVAIDPVCGMEVEIATAKASYEYEGATYYFCCNGCKLTFSKNPEQYIQPEPTVAIDPVCHMEVTIKTAQYTSHYEGVAYYFCCAGCKSTFDKNPAKYRSATPES